MATISIVATRSGVGATSIITITSGDTTNAKPWIVRCTPGSNGELVEVKEAVWNEISRQMAAI
jgi:hypothetical protein